MSRSSFRFEDDLLALVLLNLKAFQVKRNTLPSLGMINMGSPDKYFSDYSRDGVEGLLPDVANGSSLQLRQECSPFLFVKVEPFL